MTEQKKEFFNTCIRGIAEHFDKLVALQTQADNYVKYLDMLNECGSIKSYLDILSSELNCVRGAGLSLLYAVEDGENLKISESVLAPEFSNIETDNANTEA